MTQDCLGFFLKLFFFFPLSMHSFQLVTYGMLELFVCLTLCCIKNGPSNLEEQGAPCLSGRIVLIYAQSAVYTESLTLKTWFGDFHNSWYFFNLQMSVQRLTMTTAWLKSPSPIHTRTMYDQSLSTIKGKIALCLYNISHITVTYVLIFSITYGLWHLSWERR